jgi:translation initiation factor IF-2
MSELKLPRLLAAAKEFNVGQDTIIDYLAKKGFSKDELKPTAKLSEDMYYALQAEFQGDKQAKNKADLVEIPKSTEQPKRKRDEEDLSIRKDEKKSAVKEEPKVEIVEPVEKKAEVKEIIVELPAVKVEEKPVVIAPIEEKKPVAVVKAEKKKEAKIVEPEIYEIESPEIEGPKILNKIDLSTIDSSTRPRKVVKIKEEPKIKVEVVKPQPEAPIVKKKEINAEIKPAVEAPVVAVEPVIEKKEIIEIPVLPVVQESQEVTMASPVVPAITPITPVVTPEVPTASPVVPKDSNLHPLTLSPQEEAQAASALLILHQEEDNSPLIENIEVEKLIGPKILGKIELPIDSDTRPKPISREEKRKRKRIPVDKKGEQSRPAAPAHSGFNRDNNRAAPQLHQQPGGAPPTSGPNRPIQPANNRNGNTAGAGGGGFSRGGGGGGVHPQRGGQAGGGFNRAGAGARPAGSGSRVGGREVRREDKEIDAKEIQEKIKETQAKLAGAGGRGKSLKAKYRRAKREEAAEAMGDMVEDNKLHVTEFVTVSELANLMDVSFADVISKCMGLGIMVSINQRLDAEVIELVASEFNFEVEFINLDDIHEMEEEEEEDDPEELVGRAPIVTIMGHVDHGKTSLLDHIRSANVVAGEAGGITQHIGAYEVTLANGKHITFLDTPGHEAFTAMRARGAKITDMAVIVIAADDAVMPQTKEAISHAQAAGVPMIFAINKIDKDGANPQKIYEQLSQMNLLVEEWGGKYQSQEISAKKAINIDLLLEKILLEAEILDLKANPDKEATGTIIEASLDKGRGYVATILVQNGTLKLGDLIVSGQQFGHIKAMFNERNQRVTEAPPSTPVVILGLNGAPQAGEKFKVYEDESEAKDIASKRAQIMREQGLRARKHITLDEIGRRLALGNFKELNIIIKGDVDGSVEALSDSLQKLSTEEIAINVVHKAVGQISESDVLLATASDAILIGFNVRPSVQANRLAQNEGVEIKMYSIIYNAIEEVKSAMEGMLEPKIQEKEVANVEIREVYKFDKATVAGSFVIDGRIKRDAKIRLFRDGILIYPRQEGAFAELGSLKRYKDDVKEVPNNMECGLTIKNFIDLSVGDTIVAYEEEEVKRTL